MTKLAHARLSKGDLPLSSGTRAVAAIRTAGRSETGSIRHLGMTLNQFAVFVAVAKYSSLTKASAELQISQPSISQQLKQLEQNYGAKLYCRLSKGIEITAAGRSFLRQVTPILRLVAKLRNHGNSLASRNPLPKRLIVGGTFSASAMLLPALLARLQHRHPEANLEFRTSRSWDLERWVSSGSLDLAVIAQSAHSPELISEPLRREKVVLFVPARHPLAKLNKLQLSDLNGRSFVIRGGKNISGVAEKVIRHLRDRGLNIKIGLRCEDPTSVKAAVRQGMGVGVAFEETLKAEIKRGEFDILSVPGLRLTGESFVIYTKQAPLAPLAQEFLELLRSARSHGDKFNRLSRGTTLRKQKSVESFIPNSESPHIPDPIAAAG
jgi:DNA-binding transcriptional LysR family regulator